MNNHIPTLEDVRRDIDLDILARSTSQTLYGNILDWCRDRYDMPKVNFGDIAETLAAEYEQGLKEFTEDAINTSEDGTGKYVVGFGDANRTYNVFADSSDDAIDTAFDYASEHDPHFLDDDVFEKFISEEKRKGTQEDDIWQKADEFFFRGGFNSVHSVLRDKLTIEEFGANE